MAVPILGSRHQPPARNFEFIFHGAGTYSSVNLDGHALAAIAEADTATGWFRRGDGATVVRITDNSSARQINLR